MKKKLELSQKIKGKISIKRTLFFTATGLGVAVLLFVAAFFYFNMGDVKKARAENGSYSTAKNGPWYSAATWSNWASPSYNDFPGWNSTFYIDHHVTYANLKLKSGNNLIVSGTLEVSSIEAATQLNIEVTNTGKLIVKGDLTNKNGGFNLLNNGEVVVEGSLNAEGQGASIVNNNSLTILNTMNVDNGFTVNNKKDVTIGSIKSGNGFSIINTGDFTTNATITAGNEFKIDNNGKFSSSDIKAGNGFEITTKDIFNVANIDAGNNLKINSEDKFVSSGSITAQDNFTLNTEGNFSTDGITAGNQLKMNTGGNFGSSGPIIAKDNFTLNAKDKFLVDGITAGNQLKINNDSGEFISMSDIKGKNNTEINSGGTFIVIGDVEGGNQLKLNSSGEMVVTGDINGENNFGSSKDFLYLFGDINTGSNPNVRPILNEPKLKTDNLELYNLVQSLLNGELLPITLDHFKATATSTETINLEWSTISEKNNDFFTLERSTNGKTFEALTTLDGAGNSSRKLMYSFEDNNPIIGMNYYRLKQTDFNGDFEYFKIVGVNINVLPDSKISNNNIQIEKVWPNPFIDQVTVSFATLNGGEVEVLIQNAMGKIEFKIEFTCHPGENTFTFDKGDKLIPGIYYITLWQNGEKYGTKRLIKK